MCHHSLSNVCDGCRLEARERSGMDGSGVRAREDRSRLWFARADAMCRSQ